MAKRIISKGLEKAIHKYDGNISHMGIWFYSGKGWMVTIHFQNPVTTTRKVYGVKHTNTETYDGHYWCNGTREEITTCLGAEYGYAVVDELRNNL